MRPSSWSYLYHVSWGKMMAGYAYNGKFYEVLELFDWMKRMGLKMSKVLAVSALLGAGETGDLERGIQIHECAIQEMIDFDVIIAPSLMTMYTKCGLNEYSQPNNVTLVSVIPACAELRAVRLGKSAHCHAIKASMDSDVSTGTALVSMYAKCSLFNSALNLFNKMPLIEVVTWNALINQYGFESDCHVKNALIDMYAKCGSLSSAEFMFNKTEFSKDEVSWNTMIAGYMHNGLAKEALSAFHSMKFDSF
ncbi:hypothetical protein T459_13698 [Capsicum annuum]|uniref:Pentatricopeptide repeat-containing protein n=1 Tax=Capsicum annuum TaxID=4072 RepID=A0A2G2ZF96_CAPAN|nr:hypothetical protein T459_13698 [Capsicum annuum]